MENEEVEEEVGVIRVGEDGDVTVSLCSLLQLALSTRDLTVASEAVVLDIHQKHEVLPQLVINWIFHPAQCRSDSQQALQGMSLVWLYMDSLVLGGALRNQRAGLG